MPVPYKAKVSSALVNSKFVYKDVDDLKKGKLTLYKVNIGDADTIDDVQETLNEILDTQGTEEGDGQRKIYATNNFISDGDSQKTAIEKADAQLKVNKDNIDSNDDELADHETRIVVNTKVIFAESAKVDNEQLVLNNNSIDQELRLIGDGAAVTLNVLPFTAQPLDGSVITLVGHSDAFTVEIPFNDTQYGCYLNGAATLKKGYILNLVYNDELERYLEIGRNF